MARIRSFHANAIAVLLLVACARYADAVAMVMGNVFCDQCKDGQRTLFDLPINGAKVAVECSGSDGQPTISKQETTDLIGNFVIKFDGTPDLSGCKARVIESPSKSECNIVGSPARALSLSFRLFSLEMYTVDSLFLQPVKPISLCPNSHKDSTPPPPPANIPLPPLPFIQPSACPCNNWVKKEFICHWKIVSPDTKVGVVFGEEAGKRYGQNMTLWEGLQGRGDVFRALLREATASLLNSYNTLSFRYNALSVLVSMNSALHSGSQQTALKQAFSFKKANSGGGKTKCLLKPCN